MDLSRTFTWKNSNARIGFIKPKGIKRAELSALGLCLPVLGLSPQRMVSGPVQAVREAQGAGRHCTLLLSYM